MLMEEMGKMDINYNFVFVIIPHTNQAFNSQNVEKLNKTFDLLRCSDSFFEKYGSPISYMLM